MKKIEFSQKSAEGKQTRIGKKVGNVVVDRKSTRLNSSHMA